MKVIETEESTLINIENPLSVTLPGRIGIEVFDDKSMLLSRQSDEGKHHDIILVGEEVDALVTALKRFNYI